MKINDTQRIGSYRVYPQSSDVRTNGTAGKRQKDQVSFSAEAMELLGAQKNRTDDAARTQKIEKLKQEVSSGTYRVETGKLADKIAPFIYPVSGE
ncbi:flagellar biosynthesis anti-sigma factor FlgM [Cohnella candidum]|uniref:Negative regulator of flagellin synthesis n=1 Tax=Cohnella candidum TaxID=2674991 RepID=A0A3G3K0S3_9BACL|nr:flagellar biosynthesis anti-sigma factor FlgM [Cohnella candidum]AYQ74145.1 flagellar biosynthesis anti-sigma factor FlgM [Cohnella candidum]